ncbi:coiled-coil domain-containing protein 134 isoform X1 [Tachyglossus aculeatus]|uniref:coiled-coil domain-containing protein 134 isoform X1 n=1 Tax=Tachyglossus aculeatus TaxID=9261 RepID=UPI0018F65D7A|nr:coiled-coil domain-containing protein 134 isoform X1 [Tachyglossus aculeatus]XP_038612451.1 coiled-coil domain-containing protein 134 isoform X1 [Tachyglossus aculeatus]XP_038612452.1 coiled-coil domain-containing protein 134 isoform X1 [Tachyglossus aculeatus]XP_038612453.1 coiled-coil domain-containing protein 134 isoform X1 [Tachyglossus aculeatus]
MDLSQLWAFLIPLTLSGAEASDPEKPSLDASLEIYKKLFEVKRKDQLNALKNLIELNDVNQQYKIIDIMLKGLFKVLEDSRAVLIAADVPPDGPLPQDEKLKDAFSHVVENTAFFGDVALRFPKPVHHYFDRNSNWNSLIRWGIGFCNLTGIFDRGPHSQVLGLMAQELGISEKSPDYRNPFKTDHSEVPREAPPKPQPGPPASGQEPPGRGSRLASDFPVPRLGGGEAPRRAASPRAGIWRGGCLWARVPPTLRPPVPWAPDSSQGRRRGPGPGPVHSGEGE